VSASAVETAAEQGVTKVCPEPGPALDVVGMKSRHKITKEAERDANRLLRATSRVGAPVDCAAIANELGLVVFVTALKEATLGGLLMKPGDQPKIFVSKRDGYLRQRLTCALELGHYLRRSTKTNKYARVDLRESRPGSEEEPDETYAREFAACLLMPKADVEILAELGIDDLEMALRLYVPRETMQIRLKDLGIPMPQLELA
jgi:Zn-dependent peptidase ImmA (M78 family)